MTVDASATGVWQGLDQAALDRAYDQAAWAPNMHAVLARYAQRSQAARERLGEPRRIAYGAGVNEALDFFSCGGQGAPLVAFIHGGAWRSGKARDYAFVAEPLVRRGAHVAIPDFDWVQDRDGDLAVLADQVVRALAALLGQAHVLGIDPARVHLVGHSSGAHLAALAATRAGEPGLPAGAVRSLVCCSGLYELEPVRRSARSRYLRLDDAAVEALSPLRRTHRLQAAVRGVCGALESPQFLWQAQAWAQAVQAAGLPVTHEVAAGLNHFEVLEALVDAAHPLGARLPGWLGLPA
ncbi:alpha/beta hydrolase [Ramlibacter sp. MAHUQ-53]|uniref:alpha/beta hydrolase n=1 Tax=unclassified Ramlibacter TaxID=2617605 RepID=UPI00363918C6